MTMAEVQRRVRKIHMRRMQLDSLWPGQYKTAKLLLYADTLRTLLDHEISDDARALIEAALEAER